MNRLGHTMVVLSALTGCAVRESGAADRISTRDGGTTPRDTGVGADTAAPPLDGAPDTAPYAACPTVFAGPIAEANPGDPRREGLAVWRSRVLRSRDTFQRYAAEHDGTYWYTRHFDSVFGNGCATTFYVTNGMVTSYTESERSYEDGRWVCGVPSTDFANSTCFEPVTMDVLYEQCLNEVLCQDPRANQLFLQIDARGLLVECGYVPVNCNDDCYQGLGPLLLTADGSDCTTPLPGCCGPNVSSIDGGKRDGSASP
jgi:hypothetical protein